MPRINIAADANLIEELEQEAKKRGYTIYALTNIAIKSLLKLLKEGEDASVLENIVEYHRLSSSLDLVPVTFWYLENITKLAYEKDPNEYEKICEGVGEQIGSYLKSKANDINDLMEIYNTIKPLMPIRDVQIKDSNGLIEFRIYGTGFSAVSTLCASRIFSKMGESFGLEIKKVDALAGGVVTLVGKFSGPSNKLVT